MIDHTRYPRKLGQDKNNVYVYLISFGASSPTSISDYLNISHDRVKVALNELFKENAVRIRHFTKRGIIVEALK